MRQMTALAMAALNQGIPECRFRAVEPLLLEYRGPDGKEGDRQLNLGNLMAAYLNNPERRTALMEEFVAAVRESILNAILPRLEDIIPLIRARSVHDDNDLSEPINEDLTIIYALNHPRTIRYIGAEHLNQLGIVRGDLNTIAVANLRRLCPKPILEQDGSGIIRVTGAPGLETSFLLVRELWESGSKLPFPAAIGIPSRDMLLVTAADENARVDALKAVVSRIYPSEPHQLSPHLFAFEERNLVRL
jgi:uncharacterized protein YtpQ (UPF0354 family)